MVIVGDQVGEDHAQELVELVERTQEFKDMCEHLREWQFDKIAVLSQEDGEQGKTYTVDFISTEGQKNAKAGITATVHSESLQSVASSIDYYEEGKIMKSDVFWLEEGKIRSKSTSSSGGLSRPSSTMAGTACQLCRILYRAARQLVRGGGISPGNLRSNMVCSRARSSIINRLGPKIHRNHCSTEAGNVINFIQNNGATLTPRSACQVAGACP